MHLFPLVYFKKGAELASDHENARNYSQEYNYYMHQASGLSSFKLLYKIRIYNICNSICDAIAISLTWSNYGFLQLLKNRHEQLPHSWWKNSHL